jgi:hypothetical protein
MSSTVVAPESFSVSKVTFSPVKMLESGGKQAYLNYDGRPLIMQVGPLETPFGLSVFDKLPGAPPKYSVDLKLRGYDDAVTNPKTASIYNALHGLDEYMVEQGVKNSVAWFKGAKSRDVLSELYTSTVRFSKDSEGNVKPYPPTLKLQLRQREGKFETQVYDDKKRPMTDIPMEDILVKGTVMTALIQCTGVWFAGGKYGLSWKAIQIRADKVPESIRGFAFLDDGVAVAPAAPSAAAPAAAAPVQQKPSANAFAALHDDDEVDDEEATGGAVATSAAQQQQPPAMEDDEEEAEAPAPVPKKPVLKKKVVTSVAKK